MIPVTYSLGECGFKNLVLVVIVISSYSSRGFTKEHTLRCRATKQIQMWARRTGRGWWEGRCRALWLGCAVLRDGHLSVSAGSCILIAEVRLGPLTHSAHCGRATSACHLPDGSPSCKQLSGDHSCPQHSSQPATSCLPPCVVHGHPGAQGHRHVRRSPACCAEPETYSGKPQWHQTVSHRPCARILSFSSESHSTDGFVQSEESHLQPSWLWQDLL